MEHIQMSLALEAASRLLKRIGIDRFVAVVRGQSGDDYRIQTLSED